MKVLLIRFSSLGDVVLGTAAVEALAQDRPDAEVHVVTKPAFRAVFQGHPAVSKCLQWNPREGLGELARKIRREGYDWVVDLHATLRSRVLRLLVPGPRWSVYRKGALRRRVAARLHRPELLDETHVVDRYVAALRPLGIRAVRRLPRIYPGKTARTRADRLLREGGWDGRSPLVAMAPGARWATKAWPETRWRELAEEIRRMCRGVPVVVGGEEDRELAARVLDTGPGINLAGKTSIPETAAVLQRCTVLVTNDSAPLHVATAVGTRVVALFGPTVRGFGFFPLGPRDVVVELDLPCRPCSVHGNHRCPLGHHDCLERIGRDRVVGVLGILGAHSGGAR